jgi:K+-sensing histidine kinase KdpD
VAGFEARLASAAPTSRPALPSRRRVAVALRPGEPRERELLERGAALAARLETAWYAVILDRGTESRGDVLRWERTRQAAEDLGAEVVSLPGSEGPALLEFVRRHVIGDLLVGQSRTGTWLGSLRRSALRDLIEKADDLDLHIVGRAGTPEDP